MISDVQRDFINTKTKVIVSFKIIKGLSQNKYVIIDTRLNKYFEIFHEGIFESFSKSILTFIIDINKANINITIS